MVGRVLRSSVGFCLHCDSGLAGTEFGFHSQRQQCGQTNDGRAENIEAEVEREDTCECKQGRRFSLDALRVAFLDGQAFQIQRCLCVSYGEIHAC